MTPELLTAVPDGEAIIPQLRGEVLVAIECLPTGDSQETQRDRSAVENILNLLEQEKGIRGVAILHNLSTHLVYVAIFGEERWPSPIDRSLAQVRFMSDVVKPTHARIVPMIVQEECVLDGLCGCNVIFDSRARVVAPSLQSV